MVVETRKRKSRPGDDDESSSSKSTVTTSLTLWDLQIHTTIDDVLKPLERYGKPTVSFINVDNYITKYTWCCNIQMASVNEASRLLEREFITINSVNVKVTQKDESEDFEGKHKLVIKNMHFRGTKVFTFLREALEKCSCSDIEVLKKLGSDIEVFEGSGSGGVVNLLFRTKEGRAEALNILNVQKVDMDKNWIFVEVNEDDEEI